MLVKGASGIHSRVMVTGLPQSGKSQGNCSLSQSQGKGREFCYKSGNFVICYQSQGNVREFHLWSLSMHISHHLSIFDLGQNFELCPHSIIICQKISQLYLFSCFA